MKPKLRQPKSTITINGKTFPGNGDSIKKAIAAIRASKKKQEVPDPVEQIVKAGLMEKLFNVKDAGLLVVERAVGNSEAMQQIVHFNQPKNLPKNQNYGHPIKIKVPDYGIELGTWLVPQWRLGNGSRSRLISEILRGKKAYTLTEDTDGSLVMTFPK